MALNNKISGNPVNSQPKRAKLLKSLTDKILSGELEPEVRLKEEALAKKLGVSRTPVREVLLQLEQDGLVKHNPNCGFYVSPLNLEEVEELYPIIWSLESLALELSEGLFTPLIAKLNKVNQLLKRSANKPKRALELDQLWHETLIENCPNAQLTFLIKSLKTRVRRFDYCYMRDSGLLPDSIAQHQKIIDFIRTGDITRAIAELKNNWKIGLKWVKRNAREK